MGNNEKLRIFEAHIHHLLDVRMNEAVKAFERAFDICDVYGGAFLSCPCEHRGMGTAYANDLVQNLKILFLKYYFGDEFYAFAGLEHGKRYGWHDRLDREYTKEEKKAMSDDFLAQAKEYLSNGYDGIKMLEGYPQLVKAFRLPIDDEVYDAFYSYLEENNVPVTLHIANPEGNWDKSKCDAYAIEHFRWCDETIPTKAELDKSIFSVMEKHPKLRLTLAHFGFLNYNIADQERFMAYPNTRLDTTPAGDQLLLMLENLEEWKRFISKYRKRITYGTDFYAFPFINEEQWIKATTNRPKFVKNFYSTDTEHDYFGTKFRGINLDRDILEDIFTYNAKRDLGQRKQVNLDYLLDKINVQIDNKDITEPGQIEDLIFMRDYLLNHNKPNKN